MPWWNRHYYLHFTDFVRKKRKEERKTQPTCTVLRFTLESTEAQNHRSGSFCRQGEKQSIFRDKGTQLLHQHGVTVCAAASAETVLLCWCKSFPSPLLQGLGHPSLTPYGLSWMSCAWNRWQRCSVFNPPTRGLKTPTNITFFMKTNLPKYCCSLRSFYQSSFCIIMLNCLFVRPREEMCTDYWEPHRSSELRADDCCFQGSWDTCTNHFVLIGHLMSVNVEV